MERPVGSASLAGHTQLHQAVPLVERQHAMIEELCLNAPSFTSARRLAERTGVSTRTIERDVERLLAAGIPVVRRRGPNGGYRLDSVAVVPAIQLSRSELAAVIASIVALGPYGSASAGSALDKLVAALSGGATS
jgi:predicted DNA-binding transcriptional regulator YafY